MLTYWGGKQTIFSFQVLISESFVKCKKGIQGQRFQQNWCTAIRRSLCNSIRSSGLSKRGWQSGNVKRKLQQIQRGKPNFNLLSEHYLIIMCASARSWTLVQLRNSESIHEPCIDWSFPVGSDIRNLDEHQGHAIRARMGKLKQKMRFMRACFLMNFISLYTLVEIERIKLYYSIDSQHYTAEKY